MNPFRVVWQNLFGGPSKDWYGNAYVPSQWTRFGQDYQALYEFEKRRDDAFKVWVTSLTAALDKQGYVVYVEWSWPRSEKALCPDTQVIIQLPALAERGMLISLYHYDTFTKDNRDPAKAIIDNLKYYGLVEAARMGR